MLSLEAILILVTFLTFYYVLIDRYLSSTAETKYYDALASYHYPRNTNEDATSGW